MRESTSCALVMVRTSAADADASGSDGASDAEIVLEPVVMKATVTGRVEPGPVESAEQAATDAATRIVVETLVKRMMYDSVERVAAGKVPGRHPLPRQTKGQRK